MEDFEKLVEREVDKLVERQAERIEEFIEQEKLKRFFDGTTLLKTEVDESMLICKKLLKDFPLSAGAISQLNKAPYNLVECMLRCIPSREVAYSFVLDELWAMDQGNARAKKFIALSGIPKREWENAVEHSLEDMLWKILRLGLLRELHDGCLNGHNDSGEAMGVACMIVVEKIMQKYSIGVYELGYMNWGI